MHFKKSLPEYILVKYSSQAKKIHFMNIIYFHRMK
jgi:hypothetical protein